MAYMISGKIKLLLTAILIAMCMVLAASCLSSCAGRNGAGQSSGSSASEEQAGQTREGEEGRSADIKATLEDYFKEHPDEIKETERSFNEDEEYADVIRIKVEVEGNTLKYYYTFTETYSDKQVEQLKPELVKSIDGMEEQLKEQISAMEESAGVEEIGIYMEYRNGDGSVICSGYSDGE